MIAIKGINKFLEFFKYKLIFFFFKFYYLNLLTTQQKYIFSSGSIWKIFSFVQLEALNPQSLNPQDFYLSLLKKYLTFLKWNLIGHKKGH